jgi:hypothetical protein
MPDEARRAAAAAVPQQQTNKADRSPTLGGTKSHV